MTNNDFTDLQQIRYYTTAAAERLMQANTANGFDAIIHLSKIIELATMMLQREIVRTQALLKRNDDTYRRYYIPPADTWNVEQWKFKNRDQVRGLTNDQLQQEYRELSKVIKAFFDSGVPWSMEMSWTFSALIAIAIERKIDLKHEHQTE